MAAKEALPTLPPGDGAAAAPRKRSRVKFFMLLGSLLLVLGTAAGAGYWLFFKQAGVNFSDIMNVFSSSDSAKSDAASPAASAEGSAGGKNTAGASGSAEAGKTQPGGKAVPRPVPLPDLTVNLADPSGTRYLKIGMEVEVTVPEAAQELQNQNARVRDAIILLLSSKTVAELSTAQGKVLLKNEVAGRLNQILGAPRVVRIFFTNFVFQ